MSCQRLLYLFYFVLKLIKSCFANQYHILLFHLIRYPLNAQFQKLETLIFHIFLLSPKYISLLLCAKVITACFFADGATVRRLVYGSSPDMADSWINHGKLILILVCV